MILIQRLSENIEDEIKGVREYGKMAVEVKSEYPALSETLHLMARQEADHVNRLHEQISKLISDYRIKNGEPPASMLAIYEYLHKKHIEEFAEAKRYVEMYQGK